MSEAQYQYKHKNNPDLLLFIGPQRVKRWSVVDVVYYNEIPMSCRVDIEVPFTKVLWNRLKRISKERKDINFDITNYKTAIELHRGRFLFQSANAYPESKSITIELIGTGPMVNNADTGGGSHL